MYIRNSVVFLCLIFLAACNDDKKIMPDGEIQAPVLNERTDKLIFACDLISSDEMLEILGMEVNLEVLDGNRNKPSTTTSSCFYKWDDMKYDVSGVMVQVNRNPLPDEIPDYVPKYMNNKRWNGERSYDDPDVVFKYEDLEGLEFPAIYNRETYKYYFGIKDTYLCSVVFNYPASPEQLDSWFKVIATKILAKV